MAHEKEVSALSGWLVVFVDSARGRGRRLDDGQLRCGRRRARLDQGRRRRDPRRSTACALAGLTVVNPNEASVVTLFGVYKGTIKRSRILVGQPADDAAQAVAARAQLRERAS